MSQENTHIGARVSIVVGRSRTYNTVPNPKNEPKALDLKNGRAIYSESLAAALTSESLTPDSLSAASEPNYSSQQKVKSFFEQSIQNDKSCLLMFLALFSYNYLLGCEHRFSPD